VAREQRKLAAIVAADVVGYSRLMGRDESGTLARLRECDSSVAGLTYDYAALPLVIRACEACASTCARTQISNSIPISMICALGILK
jgi:hypothetical protein